MLSRLTTPLMLAVAVSGTAGAAQIPHKPVPESLATLSGGNQIYTVYVSDEMSGCGRWTARTGPGHPAGANLNVLFGNGSPGTSDTTLRSWSSGNFYRTGNCPGTCPGPCMVLCSVSPLTIVPLVNGATTTGYRLEWVIDDGGGRFIQFIQEINVEGPVDGSETVDNTVIRESHIVRNVTTTQPVDIGLRKHWDWQIASDDGPWFATCDQPTQACDRSMNLFGAGPPLYPPVYVINAEPVSSGCPAPYMPINPNGCAGNPPYIVAATVSEPSSLIPPPSPPEMLQFNSWGTLVGNCWEPMLVNNTTCAGGDSAIAYFYGLTSGTALTVVPGTEENLTQYIVAASGECPEILQPPSCSAGGPYQGGCRTAIIDGATVAGGEELSYSWASSNPAVSVAPSGGTIPADPSTRPVPAATASLDASVPPCDASAELTLTVTNAAGTSSSCTATVTFSDGIAPVATAQLLPVAPEPPGSASSPRSPGAPCSAPSSARFQVVCDATDDCDVTPARSATLVVRRVVDTGGVCSEQIEEIAVACGDVLELVPVDAPCVVTPLRGQTRNALRAPRAPRHAASPGSQPQPDPGIRGQGFTLRVDAVDHCGNAGSATAVPDFDACP